MTPALDVRAWRRPTAPCGRCEGSTSRSARASCSGCWARTARASRRSSRSPAASCARRRAAPRCAARRPARPPPSARSGYLAELFRFPDWCTADELLRAAPAARGLRRAAPPSARELLELVGLAARPRPPRRDDVQGHAAAARDRAGAGRRRRGCCCSTSRPARSTRPGGAPCARCSRSCASAASRVLLNSHLLSEVELVCDRVAIIDRGEVVAAGAPAELTPPGGVEVETGAGTRVFAARRPRRRPADRARAGVGGRGGLRRARAHLLARGRLPRGRRPATARDAATRRPGRPCASGGARRDSSRGFALRESLRRRVFLVVGVLTLAFLGPLRARHVAGLRGDGRLRRPDGGGVEPEVLAGATLARPGHVRDPLPRHVLAVFLTLGAVRGDAERGLLQPLVVRPLPRRTLLLGRWLGAAAVCAVYVVLVYARRLRRSPACSAAGGRTAPSARCSSSRGGVAIIAALSLLGSVLLASTANGIAVFMLFGAGLPPGCSARSARRSARTRSTTSPAIASWALPFEALYQAGLRRARPPTPSGFTRLAIDLGPFGGAQSGGPELWLWSFLYLAAVGLAAAPRSRAATSDPLSPGPSARRAAASSCGRAPRCRAAAARSRRRRPCRRGRAGCARRSSRRCA